MCLPYRDHSRSTAFSEAFRDQLLQAELSAFTEYFIQPWKLQNGSAKIENRRRYTADFVRVS
jgi:hypothetical protein